MVTQEKMPYVDPAKDAAAASSEPKPDKNKEAEPGWLALGHYVLFSLTAPFVVPISVGVIVGRMTDPNTGWFAGGATFFLMEWIRVRCDDIIRAIKRMD